MIQSWAPPRTGSNMARIFALGALVLGVATAMAIAAGHHFGRTLSLGGHSERIDPIEIVVGNNVLSVPENTIRHETQRRAAEYASIELYFRWPELTGYTRRDTEIFNSQTENRSVIFVTIERASMSRDMSGRYASVYRPLLREPGLAGPAGLTLRAFRPDAGYGNELLASGTDADGGIYVARCLAGSEGRQMLAGCERDIHIGNDLSMTYRFPRELLGQWQAMDAALKKRISRLIR